MSNLLLLRDIRDRLANGAVTIKTDKPRQLRNNLYRMARRRGYRWKFATGTNSVTIVIGAK